MRYMIALIAAVLLAAGCGGEADTEQDSAAPSTAAPKAAATPAGPQTRQVAWGQPAEVLGTNLEKMRVTPIGVLYHKGPYKGVDGPENGWFVAIAVKAEALTSAETVAGGAGGGGFHWRGNSQTMSPGDGNAVATPWVGEVNEFGVDTLIEPGSPEVGIVTFDVLAKGGRLLYLSPADNSITSWDLPMADQGTGLDKVRERIKLFS
jgi:hypothetical protein